MPKLRSSYMALLGQVEPTPQALDARTQIIRELMLRELGDYGERKFPAIALACAMHLTCRACGKREAT